MGGVGMRGVAVCLTVGLTWASGCAPSPPTAGEVLAGALERTPPPAGFLLSSRGNMNQAAELQGSRPGATDEASFRETLGVSHAGTLVYEMELDRIDGSREWVREIHEPDSKTLYLPEDSVVIQLLNHPEVGGWSRLRRRIPGLLLEEVASDPDSALQVSLTADTAQILWTSPEGVPMTLTIGPDSLLRSVAYPADLPALGVTTVSWHFGDYRVTEVGMMPHRYWAEIGASRFVDMEVGNVSSDASSIEALAARPGGFRGPIEVDGTAGPAASAEMEELGAGLYRVRNLRSGFHPLVVEFDDFVAVVDAPTGYPLMLEIPPGDVAPGPTPDWLSQVLADLVAESLSKPIRHVVLTHLHNDHAGGAPALVEPGVTVYASPGDTAGVRTMLATGADGAVVEAVSTSARITDGSRTMDVIQIGPNPHTHEMLVAYVHDPETLFVSDLVPGTTLEALTGDDLTPGQAFFRRWLGRTPFGSARLLTMHGTTTVDLAALPSP